LGISAGKYDESRQWIKGSHGAGTHIIFSTHILKKGKHTIVVSFETTTGELLSHTWAFEI
jgi:hypothetical protein